MDMLAVVYTRNGDILDIIIFDILINDKEIVCIEVCDTVIALPQG